MIRDILRQANKCTSMIDRSVDYATIISTQLPLGVIYENEHQLKCMPVFRIGHFPSESDSETMLKVLKWGVVPLNLKGHGMTPHSLCWARINSPVNICRS